MALRVQTGEDAAPSDLPSASSIAELIEALHRGECIVLVDDEDRENEGDLVCAASTVTPEVINFMATHARGLICLAITEERREQLGLKMMEKGGSNPISTNFTESIEAASGISTGISAADRALTIRTAVAGSAKPADLVRPGHVFPCRAEPGGVLSRAGHTEAASDLCAMAGLEPAAVICEIMNDDGSMARRPELGAFAQYHGLRIGVIADLIHHRIANERTVELLDRRPLQTAQGPCELHCFRDSLSGAEHLALCFGQLDGQEPVPVRVHQLQPLRDLFGMDNDTWSLPSAMRYIGERGQGVLLLLGVPAGRPSSFLDHLTREGQPESETAGAPQATVMRALGVGAQILREVGVRRMEIMAKRGRYPSLSGFDLEVVDFIEAGEAGWAEQ